jgi:hypothetical protein
LILGLDFLARRLVNRSGHGLGREIALRQGEELVLVQDEVERAEPGQERLIRQGSSVGKDDLADFLQLPAALLVRSRLVFHEAVHGDERDLHRGLLLAKRATGNLRGHSMLRGRTARISGGGPFAKTAPRRQVAGRDAVKRKRAA